MFRGGEREGFVAPHTRALLDAGANPNLRDKQGRTPVHFFLSGRWPWNDAGECIALLAKAGADLSARDNQGKTPLHYLAALGDGNPMFFIRGIGDKLIAAKVDVQMRDNDGNTPLHIAAKTGTRDVFDWLVKQGANLDVTNNAGETPRALAAGNTSSLFHAGPPSSETDIFTAVLQGPFDDLAKLVKANPELANITNEFGQTPLFLATSSGKTNVVEFLIQNGAKWDAASAVMAGRADVVKNLLTQEPGLTTNRENLGGTLLNLAASRNQTAVAEVLLSGGADVQAANSTGISPLGCALSRQYSGMADILIAHGATENIFDATMLGHLQKVAALIATDGSLVLATNSIGMPITAFAVATGRADVLKLLLDKGAPVNPTSGGLLLHLAASCNQSNVVGVLIRHGAKVDALDLRGFTPLQMSAMQGATEVAALLLKNNADPNARITSPSPEIGQRAMPMLMGPGTFAGDTALHLAALSCQTNVIDLLLTSGASVNATNAYGMTPLDMTRQSGLPPSFFLMQQPFLIREMLGLPQPAPLKPGTSPTARQTTIALLEQAGGKYGEISRPKGMPYYSAQVIPTAPQSGGAYHFQGCRDYDLQDFTNALISFRMSCDLGSKNQDYSYYRIWLIRSRLGEKKAATKELEAYLDNRKIGKPDDWPSKVGRFLTGQLSESDFIKAADNADVQTDAEQHCEAYFYAGSKRLIEGDKTAAVDDFHKCLATNVRNFEEYQSAEAELNRL